MQRVHTDPDVFQIRVPFPGSKRNSTNCFVVADGGQWLLIDTGAKSHAAKGVLKDALDEIGVKRDALSIFLTHLHMDHAGLLSYVAQRSTPVYVSAVDYESSGLHGSRTMADAVAARAQAEGMGEDEARKLRHSIFMYGSCGVRVPNVKLVKPNDVIHIGELALRVVDTAGHTPGHIALFEPQTRLLFGGDHILFDISPSIDLFLDGSDGYQRYLDNLTAAKSLAPFTLLQSHGKLGADPIVRIDHLIDHHRDRSCEAANLVANSTAPPSGFEVIKGMQWTTRRSTWDDLDTARRAIVMREGMAVLDHLVMTGRIRRSCDEQGINRYRILSD